MALAKKKKKDKDKLLIFAIITVAAVALVISFIFIPEMDNGSDVIKPKIAIIPIQGAITVYGQSGGLLGSDTLGAQDITKLIKKADDDISVKAIILEINSPGGTVVASKEIADAVKATEKPTVAWMREVAASGGYWVATACDKIVADPATITGSIGVSGSYLQFSELMETYGITYERLVSGEYKDIGSPYKELTPAEREIMMRKITVINALFISAISENRNMSAEYVESLATGEIFLGTEAYELDLVDVLGGKAEAQKTAEQLAGIENSKLVRFKKKTSLFDTIGVKSQNSLYWVGRGIGDAWNIFAHEESKAIKAEI